MLTTIHYATLPSSLLHSLILSHLAISESTTLMALPMYFGLTTLAQLPRMPFRFKRLVRTVNGVHEVMR